MTDTLTGSGDDTWRWWEARRLRYNVALAVAGWVSWGVAVAVTLVVGRLEGQIFLTAPSVILGLGLAYLLFMAAANILYFLGPVSEKVLRPTETASYRRRMFGLGFWGSMALPFLYPALILVGLLNQAGF
ncbi:hypothetical protein GVN24_20020 [Rhizobium sp. CRIBSB]|nr:hypothetical protein [Rhizobium sp. CRIBSB]